MPQNRRAFTLLELLTVIAILGLLMGILLPTLSSARRSAKANVCLSHLKGLGNSFVVYLNDNDDFFPPFRLERPEPSTEKVYVNSYKAGRPRWQWFLETDQGPVIDPTPFHWLTGTQGRYFDDTTPARGGGRGGPRTLRVEAFTCPSLDDERYATDIRDGAFGYNYQYLGNPRSDKLEGRWDNFAVGLHRIKSPGQTVTLADSRGAGQRHGIHSFTLDPPRMGKEVNAQRFGPIHWDTDLDEETEYLEPELNPDVYAYSPLEPRHNKRGNVVFVDAHAEPRTLRDLGYETNESVGIVGIPNETPIPVANPEQATYEADNRFFNGEGVDRLAEAHRPPPTGP